ncbi:MAG: hypothetical protein HY060_10715 [Proteobacteria bacterium]|nr:hypothetical protein [Pseudomonadota bacterium]
MASRTILAGRRIKRASAGVAGALIGLVGLSAPGPAADAPTAIETAGRAKLQICRSWIMFRTCQDYSRVDIPARVAVGDTLYLEFGSNPKSVSFAVGAIRRVDSVCTVFTEPPAPDTDETEVDKLTIAPCR